MNTGQLRLKLEQGRWEVSRDGDADCRAIFDRHYSRTRYADGRTPALFVGPGNKLVLVLPDLDGLFVWRKFVDDSGQAGVNCAVFRNESPYLSSSLILEAEAFAWERWPKESRLYTYVDRKKTRPKRDPGYCFIMAGWKPCGTTKRRKLVILEKTR